MQRRKFQDQSWPHLLPVLDCAKEGIGVIFFLVLRIITERRTYIILIQRTNTWPMHNRQANGLPRWAHQAHSSGRIAHTCYESIADHVAHL